MSKFAGYFQIINVNFCFLAHLLCFCRPLTEIHVMSKEITSGQFRYRIILDPKGILWQEDTCNEVPPQTSFFVTLILSVPDLCQVGSASWRYEIRWDQDWLISPIYTITSKDIVQGRWNFFANDSKAGSLRYDFVGLLHSHRMVNLLIEVPSSREKGPLDTIFQESFKMKRITKLGDGFFYCDRGPLDGVLILFPQHAFTIASQQYVRLWARNVEQVLLFASGLIDFFPYGTKITKAVDM